MLNHRGPSPRTRSAKARGTTSDASGNGNTGTLRNGVTWAAGRYGNGLQFDGVNDDVQIASSEFARSDRRVHLRNVAEADRDDGRLCLVAQSELGAGPIRRSIEPSGTITLAINTSVDVLPPHARADDPVEQVDPCGGHLRRHEREDLLQRHARRATYGVRTLVSSTQPTYLGEWLTGSLDEVRIYHRALSAAEIALDRGTPVDAAAPFQVTLSTPAAGALGVLTTPVTAMFSRDVNTSTVGTSTFELRDSTNTLVSATVSYNSTTRTATLTPASALTPLSDYTARVVGGSSGVDDTGSNALAADMTWTFRTAAASSVPSAASRVQRGHRNRDGRLVWQRQSGGVREYHVDHGQVRERRPRRRRIRRGAGAGQRDARSVERVHRSKPGFTRRSTSPGRYLETISGRFERDVRLGRSWTRHRLISRPNLDTTDYPLHDDVDAATQHMDAPRRHV